MIKQQKIILKSIIDELPKDNNVLGIILFGSVARKKSDQYSDIDIYIILKKKAGYSRLNFVKNGIRVDVILDTIDEMNSFLKEEKYNVKRITSNMLAHGKIIYQTRNDVKGVIKEAKNNLKLRTKYNNDEILMHKYSIDDFWGEVQRDIKNKNYLAFGLDSQLLLNNIIELFLKFHEEFLRQPNEMFIVLSKIDKNFAKNIDQFYRTGNIKAKLNILSKLVSYIYDETNGPLPQKWMIK